MPGLDAVTPGSRNYVWDQPNSQIAIFDLSGIGAAEIGDELSDVVVAVNGVLRDQLGGGTTPAFEPSAYAVAKVPTKAETAVATALNIGEPGGRKFWASVLGGGAVASGYSSQFGGLLGGGQAALSDTITLGLTGGAVFGSSASVGDQALGTTTGLLGIYGKAVVGPAVVTASLLGGYSAHTSTRTVIAGLATQTARANFTSLVAAPSVGFAAPLVSTDRGTIGVDGSATYVGGSTSGYTETGSSMNLVVGSQSIGFFDARIGLTGAMTAGEATIKAKAGVFGQNNFGTTSVPVTVLGQTVNAAGAGSTGYGIYGGLGLSTSMGKFDLAISADGQYRNDGVFGGALKLGLGGTL